MKHASRFIGCGVPAGFEPATVPIEAGCAIRCATETRGGGGDRTHTRFNARPFSRRRPSANPRVAPPVSATWRWMIGA